LLCFLVATMALVWLDALRAGATLEETLYIPSPTLVKRMSLGYTGLLADIYWTRVVQYFGGLHHERSTRYKLLAPLLDITTTLDPKLVVAYEFGSIFLAQQPPEGAGDPDAAVRLVERGIKKNPDQWRLYYHLGFIQYIEKKDYKAAADAFARGSQVPGAHPWMKIMAATMAQHGGDVQTARFLWTKIYESTDDQMIKANAIKRLRALKVDEDVAYLQDLLRNYRERTGRFPASWNEMVAGGYVRGVPVDPLGHPYRLMSDGRVEVQSAEDFPFIQHGLPSGKQPSK
jgi:tetratricopeptide (TPR) repeat protein